MIPDDDSPSSELEALSIEGESPVVKRVIENALAPFVGKVSPAYLRAMRAALADLLNSHPVTHTLIRTFEERPARQRSGEEVNEEAAGGAESVAEEVSAAQAKRRAGGGQ